MLTRSATPHLGVRGARLFASSCRAAGKAKAQPHARPRLGQTVSLEHFLQRGKALALWRRILRDTRRIGDEKTREETRGMARAEFVRNRGVGDIIRYLVGTGKTQWDAVERYIDGL